MGQWLRDSHSCTTRLGESDSVRVGLASRAHFWLKMGLFVPTRPCGVHSTRESDSAKKASRPNQVPSRATMEIVQMKFLQSTWDLLSMAAQSSECALARDELLRG